VYVEHPLKQDVKKMKKNKIKLFLTVAVFGSIIFSSTIIYANPNTIPSIASWVKYTFNGKEKSLPEGYSTIIYEGHTYVPARFVAEELGAEVVWDEKSKTVRFETKDDVIEDDEEIGDVEDNVEYKSLPVSKLINGINVEVYDLLKHEDGYTKIFLRIKNTNQDERYQFDQESVQLKVNNEILTNSDVDDRFPFKKDKSWYKDIEEDMTQEGYVMLPKLSDEDMNKGTLTLDVIKNDRSQERTSFTFNIKW